MNPSYLMGHHRFLTGVSDIEIMFKKILQNLNEHWITYVFETLVVIVGIVGAFELENWKERRQDRVKEHEYLSRIENDLKSDTIYFNRRITEDEEYQANLYTIVHEMYKTQETLEDYQNLLSLFDFPTEHLTIQNFTFLEMTNSGNLDLIKDSTLKEELISYYNKAEMYGKHIKEINEYSVAMLLKFSDIVPSAKNYDWDKSIYDDPEMYKYEDWSYINDPSSREFKLVEGVYDTYHVKFSTINPYFIKLKDHAGNILAMLKQELY